MALFRSTLAAGDQPTSAATAVPADAAGAACDPTACPLLVRGARCVRQPCAPRCRMVSGAARAGRRAHARERPVDMMVAGRARLRVLQPRRVPCGHQSLTLPTRFAAPPT